MDSVFVPSGEAAAVLSQLSSSRLDLKLHEGLNGSPSRYFVPILRVSVLGVSEHPVVEGRMKILERYGIADAMTGASSLDRMASVLSNADNLIWSHPTRAVPVSSINRPESASGERMPPEPDGRVYPEGDERW